jgi:hypothetical protein
VQPGFNSIFFGGEKDGAATEKGYTDINWTGNVSTTWEDAANWAEGIVPGPSHHVVIPSGRPRYPVISTSTAVLSVELMPGTSMQVNSGVNLQVIGNN